MKRRQFIGLATGSVAGAVLAPYVSRVRSAVGTEPAVPPRPNLVLVFPDQMRGSAMGFLGEEPVRTPVLDRFAGESVVLSQAASNWPVCSPFRAMMLTGEWPFANKVVSNCTSVTEPLNCELQATSRCWSDVLKARGYSLGYIGKWHLDSPRPPYIDCANNKGAVKWNEWTPPHRRHGFDFWYAYGTYDNHDRPMYWPTKAARDGFVYVDQWGPEHEADMAVKYIRNEGNAYRVPDRPFALAVSMNPPHMPYDRTPKRYVDQYKDVADKDLLKRLDIPPAGTQWGDYYRKNIRGYYPAITGVDDQFGRILKAVDEQGLARSTLVLFASDHGDCLGIHDCQSKTNCYEESVRIPLLVRWPGVLTPRHDDLLVSVPDIHPTVLDLLGMRDDIPSTVQGISHAQVLKTGKGFRPDSQPYMNIDADHPLAGERGVRTKRHTLMVRRTARKGTQARTAPTAQEVMLYDREADPFQLRNCADTQPEVVKELTAMMARWHAAMKDPWEDKKSGR